MTLFSLRNSIAHIPFVRYAAALIAVAVLASLALRAQILPETATDYLGFYKITGHDKSYQTLSQAGAKVMNFTADTSFACLWVPANYSSQAAKRVMVCMHGTKGSAYDEMKDELSNAQANNYAMIGVQWWVQGATLAADGSYFEEEKMYRLIDTTLKHMQAKYGAELDKVGYVGFSRGSAASYLNMFYDRYRKTNYFALSISCSGGIPRPPGAPKPILADVLAGKYGKNPFLGTSFFLYCGMKDEEWGTTMCDQISYADSLMKANGAQVVRRIQDPNGTHGGYRQNPGYQTSAVQWFLSLTSAPSPPALGAPVDKATGQPAALTLQWSTNATASLFDVQVSAAADFSTAFARDSLISANSPRKSLTGLSAGTTYYWRVRSKNNTGASEWSAARSFTTETGAAVSEAPDEAFSLAAHPNPSEGNPAVTLGLRQAAEVRLALYDRLGREAASAVALSAVAGKRALRLTEVFPSAGALPAGAYMLRASAAGEERVCFVTIFR